MEAQHTPGPWFVDPPGTDHVVDDNYHVIEDKSGALYLAEFMNIATARLIAAAPDMLAALRLHKAWADSESTGPDYGGQSRDTHPDGEKIWRVWWNNQLDLCDRAQSATSAAIAKAEGRAP